jgi:hypothetical protein
MAVLLPCHYSDGLLIMLANSSEVRLKRIKDGNPFTIHSC